MMKFILLSLIFVSWSGFAHEATEHEPYFVHTCNFETALNAGRYSGEFEAITHHYLDQNCDLSVKEEAAFGTGEITRGGSVLFFTSFLFINSVLERLINEFKVDMNHVVKYAESDATPLYLAIRYFHGEDTYPFSKEDHKEAFQFFKMMIDAGADVNWVGELKETILMLVSRLSNNRNETLIQMLIDAGARLDAEDPLGDTAQDYLDQEPSTKYDSDYGLGRAKLTLL